MNESSVCVRENVDSLLLPTTIRWAVPVRRARSTQDVLQSAVALMARVLERRRIRFALERHLDRPRARPSRGILEAHRPADRVGVDGLEALGDLQVRARVAIRG